MPGWSRGQWRGVNLASSALAGVTPIVYSAENVIGPLLHYLPSLLEEVRAGIGRLGTVADGMGKGGLSDGPRGIRLLHTPCLEGGPEPVDRCAFCQAKVAKEFRHRHVAQWVAGLHQRGKDQIAAVIKQLSRFQYFQCSVNQGHAMLNTRLHPVARYGPDGIVYINFVQVAPLASPLLAAVNTRNLKHNRDDRDEVEASTILRATPTS